MRTVILALLLLVATAAGAQEQSDTSADLSLLAPDTLDTLLPDLLGDVPVEDIEDIAPTDADSVAMVDLLGRPLFRVASEGFISARERAEKIRQALRAAARSPDVQPEDIRVVRDDRVAASSILADDRLLLVTWDFEAELAGMSTNDLAERRARIIRSAIVSFREEFSPSSILRGALIASGTFVVLVILFVILNRWRHRFEEGLHRRLAGRTVFKVLSGESLISVTTATISLSWFVVSIWVWLMFLNFALSLFPWTYRFAHQVVELVAGPARVLGAQALDQVPALFFLAVITVITVLVLRGIRFIFNEIGARRIYVRGFYPDWAEPTFNIARIAVIVFAIVVAIPYIPGSGSSAFKGMSVFLGVLVSLGSGSAMANVISGVIMIYMRPFEIGDRVQIGNTVGDVVDRNLLTTRVRTTKNERVTIPNTNVLGGQIINYTATRRSKELILHSTVTLGYDTPWRKVHELLIAAAKETENVLEDPEPYVLQKALQDFYVEYEINAYTSEPRSIPSTYSELHSKIQDKFNEAGLEILSPHFRANRNGELGVGVKPPAPPEKTPEEIAKAEQPPEKD